MKSIFTLFVLLSFLCQAQNDTKIAIKPGTQTPHKIETEIQLNYLLYLPEDYDPTKEGGYPTILFLHGAGERGDNLDVLTAWGPPKIASEKGMPFIVISPQCPKEGWWTSMIPHLKSLLDESINTYNIDTSRIYLTGLSMGGYGTFALSQVYPEYFAAVAPVCGGGTPSMVNFKKQPPTWIFHGDQDKVVPIESSRIMADALKASGTEVKFTIYEGDDHFIFEKVYYKSDLFNWFLEHKKVE